MKKSARVASKALRERTRHNHMVASLKRGRSMTTHMIAAGIEPTVIPGVTGSLRGVANRLGVEPVKMVLTHRTYQGKTARTQRVAHYTSAQVITMMAGYRPRKHEYKEAVMMYLVLADRNGWHASR